MSVVPNILIVVPSKKEKLPLSLTDPELAQQAFEEFEEGKIGK